jgi:hypothetical protein
MFSVIGFGIALMNGIPMRMGMVDNDGYNAWALTHNQDAMRAFWIQMKANEQISKGIRLKDMPKEWFDLPDDESMKNSMVATISVFGCNRLMDEHRFEEADQQIKHILQIESGIVGVHQNLLICDQIYCELIGKNRSTRIRAKLTKGQKKFMKETRLDYDDIDYCLGKYKDDYIDANDCLDDPYNKPCSFEDEDWIGGDKDLEKDYSWDLFNRKSVAPGVGGYYTVNKHGIQKDVDDAHTIRNRKKNWTKQELNNGDRMMHKWLQGKRELEDIDDSWNSIH